MNEPMLPDGLVLAIGQVVVASAELESTLRRLLQDLSGNSDYTWFLFEGQNLGWLIETTKSLLGEVNPNGSRFDAVREAAFREANADVARLARLRNAVVHGTWVRDSVMGEPEVSQRPWGKDYLPSAAPVFFCRTSRARGEYIQEHKFAAVDVARLAKELVILGNRLRFTYDSMQASRT